MSGADDVARADLLALQERGLLRSLEPLRSPPGAEVEPADLAQHVGGEHRNPVRKNQPRMNTDETRIGQEPLYRGGEPARLLS